MKKYIHLLLLLLGAISFYAQTPNIHDCNGAITVCQSVYSNTTSLSSTNGNVPDEFPNGASGPGSSCPVFQESYGNWYQFTVQNSGLLCFTIDALLDIEDYDFALFNLTGGLCSSIATTPSLNVSSNFCAPNITPPNGNTGLFPPATYNPADVQQNPCISVVAGSSYALYVADLGGTGSGNFTLSFPPAGTPGMATIYDATPPQLSSIISSSNCGISSLNFTFSEDVLCNSVSASDFQLTGPNGNHTITGISGLNCSSGSTKTSTFTVNFTPPLSTGGAYQLCLSGTSISDQCGNIAPAACLNFNINGPVSSFTASTLEVCPATAVTFTNTGSGTTHSWSFPSGSPASSSAINPPSITWANQGSYVVTHTETTGACVSTTSQTIVVNPKPTATVTLSNPSCSSTTGSATVNVSGGTPTFSYNWTPSGGSGASATGLTASSNYTVAVTDSKGCKVSKTVTVGPLVNTSAAFTASSNKCLSINSFTFTNTGTPAGTHTYSFSPSVGAPAAQTGTSVTGSFSADGDYVVTHIVNMGGSCIFTQTVQITVFPNPTSISFNAFNTVCSQPNGSITISGAGGGTPGYQYGLNGGGYSGATSFTGLAAGTYSVGVQDLNGCTFSNTIIILDSPGPTAITLTTTPASCNLNDGTIIINGTVGGTPSYSYSFNGGPYTATSPITGLGAGGYNVSVIDANGCTYTTSVMVLNPLAPTGVVLTASNTACVGNTGIINIGAVTGGAPSYSFSVNGDPFSTALTYTGQAFGSHPVIVKDANNCTFNASINVNLESGPTSVSLTPTHIRCGQINGGISIGAVTGGIPSYSYALNNNASGSATTFTDLAAGVYTITTTDGNGCKHIGTTTIIFNSNPTASLSSVVNVSCNGGSNGTSTITASAGTPGYTYTINPVGSSNGTGLFSGLPAGSYTVTVKDIANCTVTQTLVITEPLPLSSSITAQTDVSCFGGNNGGATVAGVDGTSSYQYSINGGGFQASGTFTTLSAAGYSVTVKDSKGCTKIQSVTITEPPILSLVVGSSPANCNSSDGIAMVSPSGGTPVYSYTWSSGAGNAATSNSVSPGLYDVIVRDSKGCVKTSTVIVNVKGGAIVTIANVTNATCFGYSNGSISTSMVGPNSGPYTYTWVPSGGSANTATNLAMGSYTVTARNIFGCISSATATITQPTKLLTNITATAAYCNGSNNGKASITASGSVPPYNYLWAPSGVTTNTMANYAGTYSATVTDANSCSSTTTITLTEPAPIAIVPTFTLPGCGQSNGAASINNSTTGGTSPYTYKWSNLTTGQTISNISAGTYTCTVTDSHSCTAVFPINVVNPASPTISVTTVNHVSCNGGNDGLATVLVSSGATPYVYSWSNGQNTPAATNLTVGIVNVNVTDAHGCSASQAITITQPLLLTINTTSVNPKCVGYANGIAVAYPSGGTSPYNYSWSSIPAQNTSTASGLVAGNYIVTVTDAKLCVKSQSVSLVDPPPLTISITATNITCNGNDNGRATATTTNAIGTVTYLWTDPTSQTLPTASFLSPNTYSVEATDGNNCKSIGIVTITEPTVLTTSITAFSNVSCNGGSNGFAQVTATGGTAGYNYSWSNGTILASANNLIAGTYTVLVTDTHSCTATDQITISEPLTLTATASGTNINCYQANDGLAVVNYIGGTGPYNFIWQPSLQITYNASNLAPGTHTVIVTDNNNCTSTSTVTLIEPSVISLTATAVSSNCGQSNGSACGSVTGGIGPYTYLWSNGISSSCNNNIAANIYTLTITDSKNCSSAVTININDIAAPTVTIVSTNTVSCFNGNNGSSSATFSGGVGPYTSLWAPVNQSSVSANPITLSINTLTAGNYNFQVTDGAGCVGQAFVSITEPTQIVSLTSGISNLKCKSVCTGSVTTLANGGTLPYTYSWNDFNGQTTDFANFLCAGQYSCTVTDANNCSTTNTASILEPALLIVNSSTITPISCYGLSDGGIAITPSGGTPGYSYTWSPSGGNNNSTYNLSFGTYSVVVSDANDCIANSSFIVTQPTQITGTYTTTNSTCFLANGSASFTATGGTSPYSYNWNSSPPQLSSSANGLQAGSWICNITDNQGCSAAQTVTVENTAIPVINAITFTQPSCHSQLNGSILVSETHSVTPINYEWSGAVASTTTIVNSLNGIGAGTYTVVVRDGNNCTATGVVSVNEPNALGLNINPVTTICYGQSHQIYAAGSGGTPPYTYNWSSSGFVGGGPHIVSPTSTTIYTVNVVDVNNCVVAGSQITLDVKPPLIGMASNKTGCDQDSILLDATASGGNGGPYIYSWSNGRNQQATMVKGNIALNPMTFSVVISDGCSTPITNTVSVAINPKATGSFSANKINGCEDLDVVFTGVSNTASDIFNWDFGDGTTGSGSYIPHTYTNPGMYSDTLRITNSFGCITVLGKGSYIEVYPKPTASFTMNPQTTTILEPTINFIDQSSLATTWTWNFNDPTSGMYNNSSSPNPSHDFNLAGYFDVTLIVSTPNGCTDGIMRRVIIDPEFTIFVPNAFTPDRNGKNDIFQPKGVGIDENQYELVIFDRWGEIIFTSNNFMIGWNGLTKSNTPAKEDVYVWKITVTDITGEEHKLIGHVTLLVNRK